MKFAASLLIISFLTLTACNNLVTRRDLYSPTKGSGPYTQARHTGKLPTKEQLAAKATPKPAAEPAASEEVLLPKP